MRRILGTGPVPCSIMGVGEAGGKDEFRSGFAFQGRSGELLDAYLLQNGIPRDRIRMDNVWPFWPGEGNPTPSPAMIAAHEALLVASIKQVKPKFILAIGAIACRWFLGPDADLETTHGIAHRASPRCPAYRALRALGALVVPSYHPAYALRDSGKSGLVFYDVQQFILYAKGRLHYSPPVDEFPEPTYEWATPATVAPARMDFHAGVDTEYDDEGRPYSVQISYNPGHAYVIRAEKTRWKPANAKVEQGLHVYGREIVVHSALADIPPLAQMGVTYNGIRDTYGMATLLQLEPLGLKALARRHLGMRMEDFSDVVKPYARPKAVAFLEEAAKFEWPGGEEVLKKDSKTGKWKISRPHGLGTRLKSIGTALGKSEGTDPWKRWLKLDIDSRTRIEQRIGRTFPAFSIRQIPRRVAREYGGRDADATNRLHRKLWPRIEALGLADTHRLDCSALPMFSAMQGNGMRVDISHFPKLRTEQLGIIRDAEERFRTTYDGAPHNLNSGDQIAGFLYGRLRLPVLRRGKTRGKADENTLELLKERHPAVADLIAIKQLYTQLSFINRIPKRAVYLDYEDEHRIFCKINPYRTFTGRPATSEPNLLNIPVRTAMGRRMREGFVARDGFQLLSVDLSQIELRVLASVSGDPTMLHAFRHGVDLHQITSDELKLDKYFKGPAARDMGKKINFSTVYGATGVRLYSETGMESVEFWDEIIRKWFRKFSGVRAFMDKTHAYGRRYGFVRASPGRLRYMPNLRLPRGSYLREAAERESGNHPIQGGAAEVIKLAMARVWDYLTRESLLDDVRPLMQIYDDLLFEARTEIAIPMASIIRGIMLKDNPLLVPIDAEAKIGLNWGKMEKLKPRKAV